MQATAHLSDINSYDIAWASSIVTRAWKNVRESFAAEKKREWVDALRPLESQRALAAGDLKQSAQRELAAGVLKQAAQDLRWFHGATSKIERELYIDAYRWLTVDECSFPFSFLNVCQLLNLAPEDVRRELIGDLSL
jgi:hypothetical protein